MLPGQVEDPTLQGRDSVDAAWGKGHTVEHKDRDMVEAPLCVRGCARGLRSIR